MKFAEIEPQARRNILKLAEAYCRVTNYQLSTVSRRAHSDPRFFDLLKKKQVSVTWRVTDKILSWFTENWPDDTPMPHLDVIDFYPKGINYGPSKRKPEPSERPDCIEETHQDQGAEGKAGTQSHSDRLRKLRGR
jgi:hypothetical protein